MFRFEIGIQTVNQKANLQVSRKQNFDKTSGVIKQLENKIEMHLDLIVGLPLDEWEDIKMSIEEVFKLHPPELQLGFLKFLRGTPLRNKHQQHDYVFDPMPPYQMIQSKYLSKEELYRITLLEEALEIYWNKKRALLTLKYISNQYSIFDFLLGLGEYFNEHRDFHQHTLYDIYDMLFEFIELNYSQHVHLKQMVAIDYYAQSKVKPQERYMMELTQKEKVEFIESNKLNHHQYRFIVLPISFNYVKLMETGIISPATHPLILQYNGTSKPMLLQGVSEMVYKE